jgi:hypothetical protein
VPGTTEDSSDTLTIEVVSVTLTGLRQVVAGYAAVRSAGSVVGLQPLTDGRATVVLPPYTKQGQQPLTVEYLGSSLAEAVSRTVTFTVTN